MNQKFTRKRIMLRTVFLSSLLLIGSICIQSAHARNIDYLDSYFTQLAQGSNKHAAGLYGSRSLSVPNPEIYLQSDAFFLDAIHQLNGFHEAFFLTPEEYHPSNGYSPEHKFTSGPAFSYADVSLGNYQQVRAKEIYPDCYPFLPWFDRRMAPVSVLLKSNKVNSLEKAALLYFQKKYVQGADVNNLFIVYCENEQAYIASSGTLYDTGNLPIQSINGKPVLIFSETATWYPLFNRDDSGSNHGLAALLDQVDAAPCNTPALTTDEQRFIDKISLLGRNNGLSTFQKELILTAAGSFSHQGLRRMNSANRDSYISSFTGVLNRFENRFFASTLSPIADYLGTLLQAGRTEEFETEFHSHNTWGGELWEYGMPTYTIDTGFRLDVGTCRDLSSYGSAALELAGHDWVRLHGIATATDQHYYVVDLTADRFVDNGFNLDREGKMFGGLYEIYTVIDQLMTNEGYAPFRISGSTFTQDLGTLASETLATTLSFLHDNSTIPLMVSGADTDWGNIKDSLLFAGSTFVYTTDYPNDGVPTNCQIATNHTTDGTNIGDCTNSHEGDTDPTPSDPPAPDPAPGCIPGPINLLLLKP